MSETIQPEKGVRLELAYLHGGEVVFQPGESLGPRVLSDYELVYAIEGTITYVSDDTTYAVPPGGFILGRPGFHETYVWDSQIITRHAFFHFDIERYPNDWPKPEDWPRCRTALSPVCASLFLHILQHIFEHDDWPAARPEPKDCRLVEVLIDTFIEDHRIELASFERERPEPVRRALLLLHSLVEEDPMHPLSLPELAAQANVTPKHLCRLFSRSLGYSPMQTYTLMKLQSSRPLLMRTNLSIQEIAERCGFDNPLYFSRRFSLAYGCSPPSFRAQLRSGKLPSMKNPLPTDLMTRMRQ
ncbi:AraC family transcriptional regulator [Pontiella sulfatireligans]|uniref:HTH-type transcriptional regulator CdhR n=1 Tax=Pontiella sulfatireligans TaxID=2750658 RepID=A0A6C2UGC1_9BACT|nr:AraC family transcriptional regulator [Pontiella sulfatireligans]VGO18567.1 HTH-type transcriptional regulator CdhR [Pontiella sulfatireligans]